MKILKDSITSLASEGRMTLQIPQYDLGSSDAIVEEVPDEWIVTLTHFLYPAVGREHGYLFLTRAGWFANQDKIKDAFEDAKFHRGNTWEDFEAYAKKHFQKVEHNTMHRIRLFEGKVKELKETLFGESYYE